MADYTRLDEDTLNRLLMAYDLDSIEQIVPLSGGQANSSYKVTTAHGNLTLSICDEKNEQEIARLITLLDWLAESDFPTTRVISAKDGRSFIFYQQKPVYLKTFIPGDIVKDLSVQMCFQVGAAMARLHSLELPPSLQQELSGDNIFDLSVFDGFLSRGITHPYCNWLEEKRDYLRAELDPTMDRGLIHGDLFWDNMIFANGQLVALLDFEEACWFYRLFDLGMGIVGCCAPNGSFSKTAIKGYIAGYQSICPLTDKETQQLKVFIEYAGMASSLWRFQQYNLVNPDPDKKDSYRELSDLVDQVHHFDSGDFVAGKNQKTEKESL